MDYKKILYFDMDGVLVDFVSGIERLPKKTFLEYKENLDEAPGIFSLMDPMPGAIEAVTALSQRYDVYILSTAPWRNPSAWADKLRFVQDYFPDVFNKRLILSHHKELCRGDYLIDDRPRHGANEFEGEWIHFGSERFPDWESILSYLLPEEKEDDSAKYEEALESVTDAVLERINQKLGYLVRDDYPEDWTPVDALAYEWGCLGRTIDEIESGLEDVLYDFFDICSEGTVIVNLDDVYKSLIKFLDRKSSAPSIREYWHNNG